ncbi:MAG: hypothetical protein SFU56_14870 [Capsulimonadales bacterium]|nr:hypothetical protein [Capsulimonadales bacterium]
MSEEFDESREERREAMERSGNDIAAARDRVEDTAGDEETLYQEGFTIKTLIGAFFVALIMMPGAIYLGLVAGQGLGAAAQWVTIVLFAEICRRSFLPLSRQELYLLFYVAGGLSAAALGDRGISGGPLGFLIWNQYFVQSPQAAAIAREVPWFATPQPDAAGIAERTFFSKDWFGPLGVLVVSQLLERVSWIPAGYILFRATSDVERLPFPLASVAASGATALAEASSKEESWRWQIFSTGTTIGLVFGAIYTAIPVFTGVVFGTALTIIPIPFVDLMPSTETILPAAPIGITGDLGSVLVGFILPFEMVLGSFVSSLICNLVLNPIFYHNGLLPQWHPGMGTIPTRITNNLDLWLSIGVGIQVAIALIGLTIVIKGSIEAARGLNRENRGAWNEVPRGRGDKPSWLPIAIGVWLLATAVYIGFTQWLMPTFPLWLLITYGLIWTPINSFVAARMFGLTSQGINFPFLKELTIMKSGYQKIDVWYAPIPLHDYGYLAQQFREVELTRTKFTSIIKAEILMFPLILIGGLLYWQFIWNTSPIPSPQYPYAQKIWPINAANQAIWNQINKPGGSTFVLDAIKPTVIGISAVGTLALYGVMSLLKLPMLAFYGAAGGTGAMPHYTIPTFIGACFGKFYFAKRLGTERWMQYTPVLLAGFGCGMGLVSMGAIALALISKAVQPLPF